MADHTRGGGAAFAVRAVMGLCMVAMATSTAASSGPSAGKIDFTRDVRPILADKCLSCHGPDPSQRKGKLRLDTPTGAFQPAASGEPAVVAGKPDESELYARVISDDPDEHMPPAKSGKTLTAAEVATLRAWIGQGATYRTHWAFVPPTRPELPPVGDAS